MFQTLDLYFRTARFYREKYHQQQGLFKKVARENDGLANKIAELEKRIDALTEECIEIDCAFHEAENKERVALCRCDEAEAKIAALEAKIATLEAENKALRDFLTGGPIQVTWDAAVTE